VRADEHETDCVSHHVCSYFSDPCAYLLLCTTTARHCRVVSLRDKITSQKRDILLTSYCRQIALYLLQVYRKRTDRDKHKNVT